MKNFLGEFRFRVVTGNSGDSNSAVYFFKRIVGMGWVLWLRGVYIIII